MKKKYNIAVVGETGAVGQMMIKILLENNFPFNEIFLLDSQKSTGTKINILGNQFTVQS